MDLAKKYVRCGLFNEARKIIEREMDVREASYDSGGGGPLLVMLTLIRDQAEALSLSRLLLEKGYRLNTSDSNGLCALNYAIALKKIPFVQLFLASFNFDLPLHRDRYRNTLLHYVFASTSQEIIDSFRLVYSKYYEWNVDKFKKMLNCEGLSVGELHDYANMLIEMKNKNRTRNSWEAVSAYMNMPQMPDNFRVDSSPVVICKYINQVYNSNSTLKSELLFVQHNKLDRDKTFRLNILYQVKDFSRIRVNSSGFSSKSLSDFRMRKSASSIAGRFSAFDAQNSSSPSSSSSMLPFNTNEDTNRPKTAKGQRSKPNKINENRVIGRDLMKVGENWRNDFKRIYRDFSIVNSPSYRTSSAIITAAMNHHSLNSTTDMTSSTQNDFSSNSIKGNSSSFTMSTVPEGAAIANHNHPVSKKASSATHQFLKVPQINDGKLFKNGSNHHTKSESNRSLAAHAHKK